MPNWCENTMRVWTRNEAVLDAVEAFLKDGDRPISFDRVMPVPEDVENNPDGLVGYYWRIDNWNTKWDAHPENSSVDRLNEELVYAFLTAWSPPLPIAAALSLEFADVTVGLSWDEPGMDFGGYAIFRNGAEVSRAEGGSRSSTWDDLLELEGEWS